MTTKLTVNAGDYLGTSAPDGTTDLLSVLNTALADLEEGGHFIIPPGRWPVSGTFVFARKTVTLTCHGQLEPYGSFADYLIHFPKATGTTTYDLVNIGSRITVNRLAIDGRCQSRGVRFDWLYLSTLTCVEVYRAYGTAIRVDKASENTWITPKSALCCRRAATWLTDTRWQNAWSSGTAYTQGQAVRRDYATWSSATTYDTTDAVSYTDGKSYRSLRGGNINVIPGSDPTTWTQIEPEYFLCAQANKNSDPFQGFTTNNTTGASRYWLSVLPEEPLWDFNNSGGGDGIDLDTGVITDTGYTLNTTIDNQFFYGADIRDNEHKTLVNFDNNWGNLPVLKIAFYGGQLHTLDKNLDGLMHYVIGTQYLAVPGTADTGPQGESAADRHVMVRIANGQQCKIIGANIRPAQVASSIVVALGTEVPGKSAIMTALLSGDLHGEGSNQVGVYVSSQCSSAGSTFINPDFALTGAGSLNYADGRGVARMDFLTPARAISGDIATPGLGFNAYPATGMSADAHDLYLGINGVERLALLRGGRTRLGQPMKTPNVMLRNYVKGQSWTAQTSAANNNWRSVCWSPELGLFVAVSYTSGTVNNVMLSGNGTSWSSAASAPSGQWTAVCWSPELGLFCAVDQFNTTTQRAATSGDGSHWALQTTPSTNRKWKGICWSSELRLFVAVTDDTAVVMTSPDGVNWTERTAAYGCLGICWSPEQGQFVAVGTNRVMTSPDGIVWTARTAATSSAWTCVCWSPELSLFVAVTNTTGVSNHIMTSPDGITWAAHAAPSDQPWTGVSWSPELGLFAAVATTGASGDRIMTSPDGANWTAGTTSASNQWSGLCWSPELGVFCAVGISGTGNRVMTSKSMNAYSYP